MKLNQTSKFLIEKIDNSNKNYIKIREESNSNYNKKSNKENSQCLELPKPTLPQKNQPCIFKNYEKFVDGEKIC